MPPAIATEAGRFHGRWRTEGSARANDPIGGSRIARF